MASLAKIASVIYLVRGKRVMIDADLAAVFGVSTKRLNEQVRRNRARFPEDFMFRLRPDDLASLRSQIATSNQRGGRRYLPYAFTEHGAVMLANVLKSRVAVDASIQVVRAFLKLREFVLAHAELAQRLDILERKYDASFKLVFDAIRDLMPPARFPQRRIGFHANAAGTDARGRR